MNPEQTVTQIIGWHERYCQTLREFTEQYAHERPTTPRIMFSAEARNWIGYYHRLHHVCVYSIPWALTLGVQFEDIVAHECAHGYQYQMGWKPKVHGELFYFLLRNVCGKLEGARTFDGNRKRAQQLALLLKMHEYTPPMEVTEEARRRRRKKRRANVPPVRRLR